MKCQICPFQKENLCDHPYIGDKKTTLPIPCWSQKETTTTVINADKEYGELLFR